MPKLTKKKVVSNTSTSTSTNTVRIRTKHKPSYCRYCTAKLPYYMNWCNTEHRKLNTSN